MNTSIYQNIATRTAGDIYIGVVGPVRTGKSTFIKRFMEQLVLPAMSGSAAAHRPHHTDVDIPAGACADLATDAVLFLFLQGPSPLPVALRTAPVGVGVLVVSYEKGALIMPGRS